MWQEAILTELEILKAMLATDEELNLATWHAFMHNENERRHIQDIVHQSKI